jgi:hypothetical protein
MVPKQLRAFARSVGPLRAERKLARQRRILRTAEHVAENDPPHCLPEGSQWRVEEERARVEFWAEIAALARGSDTATS